MTAPRQPVPPTGIPAQPGGVAPNSLAPVPAIPAQAAPRRRFQSLFRSLGRGRDQNPGPDDLAQIDQGGADEERGDWSNPRAYAVGVDEGYDMPEPGVYHYEGPQVYAPGREPRVTQRDIERQMRRRQAAARFVAHAKHNVESRSAHLGAAGRRTDLATALEYANVYLRREFDFRRNASRQHNDQDGINYHGYEAQVDEAAMIEERFRFFEDVTIQQMELARNTQPGIAERGFRMARALAGVLPAWMRGRFVRWGIPAIFAAVAVTGVLTGGITWGALAVGAGIGAFGGATVGSMWGAVRGWMNAGHERFENYRNGETLQALLDEQMEDLMARRDFALGQGDYDSYEERSNQYVYGKAEGARQRNNRRAWATIGRQAGRGAFNGAWRGALAGAAGATVVSVHGHMFGGGHHDPSAADATGNQNGEGVTPSGQPADVWIRQHDGTWTANANNYSNGYADGATLYAKIQHHGHYTDSQMVGREFPDYNVQDASALEQLAQNGAHVQVGGQWHMGPDGIHVSGDGTHGWVESMQADHYVLSDQQWQTFQQTGVLPDPDKIMHFHGDLTQQQQAALIDLASKNSGYTVLSHDQVTNTLQQFQSSTADTAANLTAQPGNLVDINNIVNDFKDSYLAAHGVEPVAGTVDVQQAQQILHGVIAQHAASGTLGSIPRAALREMASSISGSTGVPAAYIVAEFERARLALAA